MNASSVPQCDQSLRRGVPEIILPYTCCCPSSPDILNQTLALTSLTLPIFRVPAPAMSEHHPGELYVPTAFLSEDTSTPVAPWARYENELPPPNRPRRCPKPTKRVITLIIIISAMILAIAVGVGLGVGLKQSPDNGHTENNLAVPSCIPAGGEQCNSNEDCNVVGSSCVMECNGNYYCD
jgi:hypothetical protein